MIFIIMIDDFYIKYVFSKQLCSKKWSLIMFLHIIIFSDRLSTEEKNLSIIFTKVQIFLSYVLYYHSINY